MRVRIATAVARALAAMAAASLALFVALQVAPNPLEQLRRNPEYTLQDIERLTQQFGWDQPWYSQYFGWLSRLLHGDMGESLVAARPASELIAERLPLTLLLTGLAEFFAILVAVPLGVWLARRAGSRVDRVAATATFALLALPGFLIAVGLQIAGLKLAHATGAGVPVGGPAPGGSAGALLAQLALPVFVLASIQVAAISRYQRSNLIAALSSDYVVAAKAKGLSSRWVSLRHALPNTAGPMIAMVALDVTALMGGAVAVEAIFGLPGLGSLLLKAVTSHDVVLALDITLLMTIAVIGINAVADLLSQRIDPRIQERKSR